MMLVTLAWVPPIWAAMLPHTFSPATTRTTRGSKGFDPWPPDGADMAHPASAVAASTATTSTVIIDIEPRARSSDHAEDQDMHPPYLGMVLITTSTRHGSGQALLAVSRPISGPKRQPCFEHAPGRGYILGAGTVSFTGDLQDGRDAL